MLLHTDIKSWGHAVTKVNVTHDKKIRDLARHIITHMHFDCVPVNHFKRKTVNCLYLHTFTACKLQTSNVKNSFKTYRYRQVTHSSNCQWNSWVILVEIGYWLRHRLITTTMTSVRGNVWFFEMIAMRKRLL